MLDLCLSVAQHSLITPLKLLELNKLSHLNMIQDLSLIDIATYIATFIVGVISGAAGKYYSDKQTDRRRKNEEKTELQSKFKECKLLMPELFAEMTSDLRGDKSKVIREFAALANENVMFQSSIPRFVYFGSKHPNMFNQFILLLNAGFISDVTVGNAKIYRMEEHFVTLLRS